MIAFVANKLFMISKVNNNVIFIFFLLLISWLFFRPRDRSFDLVIVLSTSWSFFRPHDRSFDSWSLFDLLIKIVKYYGNFWSPEKNYFQSHDHSFNLLKKKLLISWKSILWSFPLFIIWKLLFVLFALQNNCLNNLQKMSEHLLIFSLSFWTLCM